MEKLRRKRARKRHAFYATLRIFGSSAYIHYGTILSMKTLSLGRAHLQSIDAAPSSCTNQ